MSGDLITVTRKSSYASYDNGLEVKCSNYLGQPLIFKPTDCPEGYLSMHNDSAYQSPVRKEASCPCLKAIKSLRVGLHGEIRL